MTTDIWKTLAGGVAFAVTVTLAGAALADDALAFKAGLEPAPGAQDVAPPAKAKTGPFKIGFSNISVVNTWRVQMAEEAKFEASRHKEIGDFLNVDGFHASHLRRLLLPVFTLNL